MVPAGYVAVDTIEQHSHGVNHLFNHGQSELNWPPLFIRRDYLSLIAIHDMLHDRSCFGFSMYFTFSSSCTRSHSLSLYCKQSNINSYRYSFLLTMYFYGIAYVTQFCQFLIVVHLNSHYVTS